MFVPHYHAYLICPCNKLNCLLSGKKQMSRHFKKKLMHQSLTIIGLYPYVAISYVGKAVFKYTFNHIRDNKLIYSNNYGFMSGHSTAHQLIHLYHVFCEALDNNEKSVFRFFTDISKAVGRVWHASMLHKLKKNNGITGTLIVFRQSNRKKTMRCDKRSFLWIWHNRSSSSTGVCSGFLISPYIYRRYQRRVGK